MEPLPDTATRKQPLIEKPVSMASDGQVQISPHSTLGWFLLLYGYVGDIS